MTKASAAKRRPPLLDAAADYGPSMHRTRGGYWESAGAGLTVLEDREDPDFPLNKMGRRPVVRGARRWDALLALLNDGVITGRQKAAADRWLDDLSRATGGSHASFMSILVSGGDQTGLTEAQRKALRAVRRVALMLNLTPQSCRSSVLWRVAIDNWTPADWAATFHVDQSRVPYDWLRADLDRLDACYNPQAKSHAGLAVSYSAA